MTGRPLDAQTAIVTGGGRGFGRAIAETLAGLGTSVVVASRNAPELDDAVTAIKLRGGKALAQTADVADERQVQELVLAAERWVGPPSILVNNAGVRDPRRSNVHHAAVIAVEHARQHRPGHQERAADVDRPSARAPAGARTARRRPESTSSPACSRWSWRGPGSPPVPSTRSTR